MGCHSRIYAPVAQHENLAMVFTPILNPNMFSASADNDGITATVTVDEGMFNSPRLTPDSLRITVCHELGHIFGGGRVRKTGRAS